MPECQNCGADVSIAYADLYVPRNVERPQVCCHCDDAPGVRPRESSENPGERGPAT